VTRYIAGDFARDTSMRERAGRGMLRRMVVKLTTRPLWQMLGHLLEGARETVEVEPFQGLGFFARPRANSRTEAIVAFVGGAEQPVAVATRDEDLRRSIDSALGGQEEDSAIVASSTAIVYVRANGEVEIRTPGGAAVPLLTRAEFLRHGHATAGTGTPSPPIDVSPLVGSSVTFPGTSVLKGE